MMKLESLEFIRLLPQFMRDDPAVQGLAAAVDKVLSLAGSHSPPHLPRMPSNTLLISGPAVGAAQILIWSYSCVFLPPMSTAIRTSAFFFMGILNVILYIP